MTLLMGAYARCGHVVTIETDDDMSYEGKYELIHDVEQELCPDCRRDARRIGELESNADEVKEQNQIQREWSQYDRDPAGS